MQIPCTLPEWFILTWSLTMLPIKVVIWVAAKVKVGKLISHLKEARLIRSRKQAIKQQGQWGSTIWGWLDNYLIHFFLQGLIFVQSFRIFQNWFWCSHKMYPIYLSLNQNRISSPGVSLEEKIANRRAGARWKRSTGHLFFCRPVDLPFLCSTHDLYFIRFLLGVPVVKCEAWFSEVWGEWLWIIKSIYLL